MKRVGDFLNTAAVAEPDPALQALFARSAFNRYYYACHFTIRNEIKSISSGIDLAHGSNMGGVLHGDTYKRKIQKKLALLKDTGWEQKIENLNALIKTLLASVTELYDARQLADYKDDAQIKTTSGLLSISSASGDINLSIDDAQKKLDHIYDCLNKIQVIKQEAGII